MADRMNMLATAFSRPSVARSSALAFLLLAAAACAVPASFAEPYVYVARANLQSVDHSFVSRGTTAMPGAGVRAFEDPDGANSGTERFEIRWFANSPGIPPGVLVLLESLQERSPIVKNHVLRIPTKSEGYVRSVIEISSEEIQQAGRTQQWRVRIIWRGRLLASQTSANWGG